MRPETKIQSEFVKWFSYQYPRLNLMSIPNGAVLAGDAKKRAIQWNVLKATGAKKGAADLFLAKPSKKFSGCFIEVKTPDGDQSPAQKEFQEQVISDGYEYICEDSVDGLIDKVTEYIKTI